MGPTRPTVKADGEGVPGEVMWVTTVESRVRLCRLTSLDGADHFVSDEEMCSGIARRMGDFFALCGELVGAAPMVEPPAPVCPECQVVRRALHAVHQAAWEMQHGRRARPRRRRRSPAKWWRGLFGPESRQVAGAEPSAVHQPSVGATTARDVRPGAHFSGGTR